MVDKTFREMTDDEIQKAFRRIAISCQTCDDPKATFEKLIKERVDCPYTVAISYSQPNGAGQRMWMGMVNSPSTGKTINF